MKRKHITNPVLYLILASAAPTTRGIRGLVAMEALSLRHVFAILLLWRVGSNVCAGGSSPLLL